MTQGAIERLHRCGVVPVLTIPDIDKAVPLAKALADGGIDVLEITLRTPCALDAIQEIANALPQVCVGAGTVLTPADLEAVLDKGAEFVVTPATSPGLVEALKGCEKLVIPGVFTPSEALSRLEEGFRVQKLFPAAQCGGASFLKAVSSPMKDIRFMPTGGISAATLGDYLALPNVVAAGGSWMASSDDVTDERWADITRIAQDASAIVSKFRST